MFLFLVRPFNETDRMPSQRVSNDAIAVIVFRGAWVHVVNASRMNDSLICNVINVLITLSYSNGTIIDYL